jgi:hypothetical protein
MLLNSPDPFSKNDFDWIEIPRWVFRNSGIGMRSLRVSSLFDLIENQAPLNDSIPRGVCPHRKTTLRDQLNCDSCSFHVSDSFHVIRNRPTDNHTCRDISNDSSRHLHNNFDSPAFLSNLSLGIWILAYRTEMASSILLAFCGSDNRATENDLAPYVIHPYTEINSSHQHDFCFFSDLLVRICNFKHQQSCM